MGAGVTGQPAGAAQRGARRAARSAWHGASWPGGAGHPAAPGRGSAARAGRAVWWPGIAAGQPGW